MTQEVPETQAPEMGGDSAQKGKAGWGAFAAFEGIGSTPGAC